MSRPTHDRSGRRRNVTVAFRVSREEAERIDALVAISGLTKQDYILARLLDQEVTVIPSSRVHRALREQMDRLYREERRITAGTQLDPDMADVMKAIAEEYVALGKVPGPSDKQLEDARIASFNREENE